MSYSFNPTAAKTTPPTGTRPGSNGAAVFPPSEPVPTEPMKRMPPRVILHPNGRPQTSSLPSTNGATAGPPPHRKLAPTTTSTAAPMVHRSNGAALSSGNSPTSASVTPPGAAAALHVMQNSNNRNAFVASMPAVMSGSYNGNGSGAAPVGSTADEALRRTEEQMQELRRKLSAMHADIRRLTPSATTPPQALVVTTANSSTTSPPGKVPGTRAATGVHSGGAHRGQAHHLSPLPAATTTVVPKPAAPPKSAAKSPAAPAVTKPDGKATIVDGRKLSLDDQDFLDSPNGSSSDEDENNSSSSSSSSSDDDQAATTTAATAAVKGPTAPAKPKAGSPTRNGAAPARQGFGFKRPEKPATATSPPSGKVRGANLFTNDPAAENREADKTTAAAAGAKPSSALAPTSTVPLGRAAGKRNSDESRRGNFFSSLPGSEVTAHDNAQAVDGLDVNSRRRAQAVKTLREQFFAPVPRQDEVLGPKATDRDALVAIYLPGTPCSWLCCISLAISFVTGVPTSIEKLLKTNHLGVHYLSLPVITLAEMYDFTNDYIHSRFHRHTSYNASCAEDEFDDDEEAEQVLTEEEKRLLPHVHCEMATLDSEVIDPVEESEASYGMGEHAPVTSLAQFRKELVAHNDDERSLFVFHYDPYIIEEHETRLRANMAETEEEEAAIWDSMLYKKGQSRGAYGLLVSFNAVKATVTIVSPHLTKEQFPMRDAGNKDATDGGSALSEETKRKFARFTPILEKLVLEEHTISVQTLYEATRQRDAYTQLSRGFVRVFINEEFAPKVPSIFPLFVLDGSSSAGLMTSTLDVSVAPHVLGLAMMHHLSITFLLSDNARRKQSSRNLLNKANVCDVKLRGIPLTKIIQQLRLPVSMMVAPSDKDSIALAFAWYYAFLQQLQVSSDVRLGLVRPTRRGGAEDGQPSIDEEEFLAHLRTAVSTQSVLLISFDVNVALNVRISTSPEPAHFAIVIGLDEERGIVRLADVNVKRFRKTWHIPFYRLYNAVMGYGYMMAAKEKKTIKALNGKKTQEEVLKCGRYALPPVPNNNSVVRFEYPRKAYALTVFADAMNRLGFPSDVERFLNFSGFHISYFLSKHLPLEGAAMVVQNFSHYALDDAVSVVTKHYDYTATSAPPVASKAANDSASAPTSSSSSPGEHHIYTEQELLEDIQFALASPQTRQLIAKYDPLVIAEDTQVFNGSTKGGCYAIVADYDSFSRCVILNNADPVSYYRAFAVPLPLFFKAVSAWDPEDLRALGTLLMTKEHNQEGLHDNTKGYDFAHALVHHPFRPVFSAACSCLALAATELMINIAGPTMLGGAPLAVEEEEKRKYKRYNNIFSAEDILYALPSFSVHEWQNAGMQLGSMDVATMANTAFKQLRLPLVAIDVTHGEADGSDSDALTNPETFLKVCNGVSGLLTITLLAFDTDKVYGVPGSSMGLINRVEIFDEEDDDDTDAMGEGPAQRKAAAAAGSKGCVQLLEGEPCRWGAVCERSAEALMPCVTAILRVMEVAAEESDDN